MTTSAPVVDQTIEKTGVYFGNKLPPYKNIKRLLVEEALRRTNGNRTRAAELLGTSRQVVSSHLPDLDSNQK